MSNDVKRLADDDWELLLPTSSLTLGKTVYSLEPMGLAVLASVVKDIKTIQIDLKENEVTLQNYSDIDKLISMTSVVLEKIPQVLQKASNIHVDDLARLPLNVAVQVLGTVLDVNIKSHEGLEKNLLDLAMKIAKVTNMTDMGSETSSNSLLSQDTNGKTSKTTHSVK